MTEKTDTSERNETQETGRNNIDGNTSAENAELQWMQQHEGRDPGLSTSQAGPVKDHSHSPSTGHGAVKRVVRKTYLRGQAIDPPRRSRHAVRRKTERDLLDEESEIPYVAFESAGRNLVCSLIERQDEVAEKVLLMLNDLQYRVDDLETELEERAHRKAETVTE